MSRLSTLKLFGLVLCIAVFTTAGNCGNLQDEGETAAKSSTVTIFDYKFKPQELEVSKGTEVTWVNKDKTNHSVTADNNAFDEILAPGEKFSHTFEKSGTFRYKDRLNSQPGLLGKIIVK